ncbi:MAG: DUF2484 family protein, partial [Paracoccaceae bacterium]
MNVLILCCVWTLSSGAVAMLPVQRQYIPGVVLILLVPVLIVMVGLQYNWGVAVLGAAAFLSMFRNPLEYF